MIRLQRIRTKQAIQAVFRGAKRIEKALTLLVEADAQRKFDSGYWKRAKTQLKIESGGKCAYCEAPTTVVAHGDVEHFRPKSRYWWLANAMTTTFSPARFVSKPSRATTSR